MVGQLFRGVKIADIETWLNHWFKGIKFTTYYLINSQEGDPSISTSYQYLSGLSSSKYTSPWCRQRQFAIHWETA